jgi:hypothetical protein
MEMVSHDSFDRDNSKYNSLENQKNIKFSMEDINCRYFVDKMMLVDFFVLQSLRGKEPVE